MAKPSTKKNFDYPKKTSGSETAERVRSEANNMSEDERSAMFELAKKLIYGGNGVKETVRTGH
jgi:hypothetical protein